VKLDRAQKDGEQSNRLRLNNLFLDQNHGASRIGGKRSRGWRALKKKNTDRENGGIERRNNLSSNSGTGRISLGRLRETPCPYLTRERKHKKKENTKDFLLKGD